MKFALSESGCRIGNELAKMSRDHFWRSISRDTNVEVSALSPWVQMKKLKSLRNIFTKESKLALHVTEFVGF